MDTYEDITADKPVFWLHYQHFITARIRRMTGGYIFTLCVNPHLGGVPDPALDGGGRGGVPDPALDRGGYLIQPWMGGRAVPDPALDGGGVPDQALDGGGGVPVSVKGKIFDTRFGLIHVQNGKKILLSRDPPPPSKGKFF